MSRVIEESAAAENLRGAAPVTRFGPRGAPARERELSLVRSRPRGACR
jgi:hypothetical protein